MGATVANHRNEFQRAFLPENALETGFQVGKLPFPSQAPTVWFDRQSAIESRLL
jgi:hypothetical protein